MQEKANNSIENILESIAKGNDSVGTGAASEFVIGNAPEETGLVFENTTEDAVNEESRAEEKVNVRFETVESVPVKDVEFSVPEVFDANGEYGSSSRDPFSPRVAATYVPRFTGAADSYRVSSDPRPKYVKPTVPKAEIVSDIDPTAEIDEAIPPKQAKEISVNKPDNDELESASKVFKFVENELLVVAGDNSSIEKLTVK